MGVSQCNLGRLRSNVVCSELSFIFLDLTSVFVDQPSVKDPFGRDVVHWFQSWFIGSPSNDLSSFCFDM
jgi:hypothetical protein